MRNAQWFTPQFLCRISIMFPRLCLSSGEYVSYRERERESRVKCVFWNLCVSIPQVYVTHTLQYAQRAFRIAVLFIALFIYVYMLLTPPVRTFNIAKEWRDSNNTLKTKYYTIFLDARYFRWEWSHTNCTRPFVNCVHRVYLCVCLLF